MRKEGMPMRIRRRNWLGETWKQEQRRRLLALEASLRSIHDRINDLDERKANRDDGQH